MVDVGLVLFWTSNISELNISEAKLENLKGDINNFDNTHADIEVKGKLDRLVCDADT